MIDWPGCLVKQPIQNETENTDKFEILLWYSKIINEIKSFNENNYLKIIMKLNEFNEIMPIINLLMNIYNRNYSDFGRNNLQIIYGTLNALFIFKLYKKEKTSFIWNIENYINGFKNREEINDLYFISLIDDNLKSLKDNFKIYIPKFKKSDLLFLFINVTKNNNMEKDYKLGPLLEEFNCQGVKQKLIPLIDKYLNKNDKEIKASDIIDETAKVIYQEYLYSEGKNEDILDHNSIKNSLKNIENICDEKIKGFEKEPRDKSNDIFRLNQKKKAAKIILTIINLAELMDNESPESHLEFDDIKFFDDKLAENFINKYPTLFYFFNKNLLTYRQIKDKFSIAYENNKLYNDQDEFYQSFYFWIFGLRIVSSINCISFEKISDELNEYASNEVKNIIKEKLKRNENFGTKWINFLLENFDPNYEDNNIISIYKYIKRIIGYLSNVKNEFKEVAISLIKRILSHLIKNVFKDSLNGFLQQDFSSNEELIEFFKDPDSLLKRDIEKDITNKYNEIIESQLYVRELKPFYDKFLSYFETDKSNIKSVSNAEKKITESQFLETRENERKNTITSKSDKISNLIGKYQKVFNEFIDTKENSVLIKFNNITRKLKTFDNKETRIDDLIKGTNQALKDLKEIGDLIENNKQKTMNLKEMKDKIENIYENLFKYKYYNKYNEIKQKLHPIHFIYNDNKDITNLEKSIDNYINIINSYKFSEDEELNKYMDEKKSYINGILKDIIDIDIIYNNYCYELKGKKYEEKQKKFFEESKKYEKEKKEIDNKIVNYNANIKDKEEQINKNVKEIEEIMNNQAYLSDENKIRLESDLKELKAKKEEIIKANEDFGKEKENLNNSLQLLEKQIEEKNEKLNEMEIEEEDEEKIQELFAEYDKIKEKKKELENKLNNLEEQHAEYEGIDINNSDENIKDLENKLNINAELIKKIIVIKKNNKKKEKELNSFLNNKEKLNKKSTEMKKIISNLLNQSNEQKIFYEKEVSNKKNIDITKTIMKEMINKENKLEIIKKQMNVIKDNLKNCDKEIKGYLSTKISNISKNYSFEKIKTPFDFFGDIEKRFKKLFQEEYKIFNELYCEIYDLYNQLSHCLIKESLEILFNKDKDEEYFVISYFFPNDYPKNKCVI